VLAASGRVASQPLAFYFTIQPTAAATACAEVTPMPSPTATVLYQVTNASNQVSAGLISFFDGNSGSCTSSQTPIWGPLQLGAGQTVIFGTNGIPLLNQLYYKTTSATGALIVVTL
jgi:hypothetical protein